MRIAVIGSGAMGSLYGGYLSRNNEVILIDSYKEHIEEINQNGLIIIEEENECKYDAKAYFSGTYNEKVDLVIVFVKATNTYEAIKENKNIISDDTLVMTLQNGSGNDKVIMNFVKRENIVIGTSKHNSVLVRPGVIHHKCSGVTTLGTMDIKSNKDESVGELLSESGLEIEISEDIPRIIWSKLFINMSVNTLTALLQTKIGYACTNEYAWNFVKRIVYEAVEVAEADGTYFDRREALESVRSVCEEAGNGYSSMYQDRINKRVTEIDRINGAVVEQAKLYGVPTPYNSLIVDLIHAIEGAYIE